MINDLRLSTLVNPDACERAERTFELVDHEWVEEDRKNQYTISILERGVRVGSFDTRTSALTYCGAERHLEQQQRNKLLRSLRSAGVIPDEPDNADWRVGARGIPESHPWRQRESKRYESSTYQFRAKPLTRNRLDVRLRPDVKDAFNYYITTFGWTATQVIEHFIVSAYLRDAGKSMLPATDETPALPDGMHDF